MISNLIEKRRGGNVKRFHTVPVLQEHLVSSHSWGVALCVLHVNPECSKKLLVAALEHDIPEYMTGDIPATTKWANPNLGALLKEVEAKTVRELGLVSNLTPYEQEILKTADLGDLILCCVQEHQLGNKGIIEVIERCFDFLEGYCKLNLTNQFRLELAEYTKGATNG